MPALETARAARRRVAVVLFGTGLWAGVLFASAGDLGWLRGWIYVALHFGCLAANWVVLSLTNPALIAVRGKKHSGTKGFDKVFSRIYTILVFVLAVVAGFDAVRFRWSSMSLTAVYFGAAMFLAGNMAVVWAMAVNPHLETTVRIQSDRGHRVITTGPYRFVRHPMYVGLIFSTLGVPLILGSRWAYVPAGLIVLAFVWRTALEDRTLRRELPGYEEYAGSTRYRLAPRIW